MAGVSLKQRVVSAAYAALASAIAFALAVAMPLVAGGALA